MKKAFVTVLMAVLAAVSVNGQSLSYDQLKDVPAKKMSYLDYTEYVSKNGSTFKVGDSVKIGKQSGANRYDNIITYVPMAKPKNVTGNLSGKELLIKKIRVNKDFTGNNCVSLWVDCGFSGSYYIIDLEAALESGEIAGDGMTEEQALKEIETLKKKFELDIITEEEYKEKRAELIKYIK